MRFFDAREKLCGCKGLHEVKCDANSPGSRVLTELQRRAPLGCFKLSQLAERRPASTCVLGRAGNGATLAVQK